MVHIRRRRAPLWFVVIVAAACAVLMRVCAPAFGASPDVGAPHAPPSLAWWAFLGVIIEVLWKGVEVAARVTLQVLGYSVNLLWRFARNIANGAHELASFAFKGLKQAWSLLRGTYEHVLKPAWQKVWTWVDRVESWLQRTFGPLLSWLRRVRDWILHFWATYIRPILDLVDITRRALHVLGALGLEWARTLDRRLGAIEDWIERRFQDVLGTLNDVINVVNRIMTADGLFQRLTFIRTLQRDWNLAWKTLVAGYAKPVTESQRTETDSKVAVKTQQQIASDVRAYMRDRAGPNYGLFSEMAAQWRKQLQAK